MPCPPEQVLWLSAAKQGSSWRLEDGSEVASPLSLEEAALHHPGAGLLFHHGRTELVFPGHPRQYPHRRRPHRPLGSRGRRVQGQARGIHANWLQPFERVQARLAELLG